MADDVIIRISAKNLTKEEFDKARRQLDQLGKKAGLANQRFGNLGKGLGRAAKDVASFNPTAARASSLIGSMGISAGAAIPIIGAAGLAGAIGIATRNAINMGVELTTLRDKTGISLGGLQELQFVAEQTNVGFNQVTDAVVRLGRRAAAGLPETIKGLDRIGVSVDELLALDPAAQFELIVAEIAKLPTEAEQSAAAMAVFGDAGLQILPLLRSDVADLAEEFQNLGGPVSDDVLEAGRRLDDSWTSLKKSASTLTTEALHPLIAALADVAEGAASAIKQQNETLRELRSNTEFLKPEELSEFFSFMGTELSERQKELIALNERRRKDAELISAEIDRLNKLLNGTAEETEGVAVNTEKLLKLEESRAKVLRELNKMQAEGARHLADLAFEAAALDEALGAIEFLDPSGRFGGGIPGITSAAGTPFLEEIPIAMREFKLGVVEVVDETEKLVEAQNQYNEALQAANALAQLIGGSIGQLIGQTFAAAAALENLGKSGGLSGLFEAGKGDATGFLGVLGGIGGLAGGLGPLLGLGGTVVDFIGGLFGRDAGDVAKDVGRDIGGNISEGLAEAILESGENAQLFLREIFSEGAIGIDRLAEEVGDLFSFFERGEITEDTLLGELDELLPILIANFDDLGDVGQAQIERIIGAAQQMNIDLGETGDALERLAKGIPEITLEGLADKLGLTTAEARELTNELGVNIQTDLERLADELDIPVAKVKEIGAALEEEFGLGIEDIQTLLDDLGIDIGQLAEKLEVDLPEAAQTAADSLPETDGGLDAVVLGDTAGRAIADQLIPGQRQLTTDIGAMRGDIGRLAEQIARAVRDAIAQSS